MIGDFFITNYDLLGLRTYSHLILIIRISLFIILGTFFDLIINKESNFGIIFVLCVHVIWNLPFNSI